MLVEKYHCAGGTFQFFNVSANYPTALISDGNSGSFFDQAFAMNARLEGRSETNKAIDFPCEKWLVKSLWFC